MAKKVLCFILFCLKFGIGQTVADESKAEDQGGLKFEGITFTQQHADAAKAFVNYLFSYDERHSEGRASATKIEDTKIEETIPAVTAKNVVRVGVLLDCFPFTFKQKDDFNGFEIELMKLIAEKKKFRYEFQGLISTEIIRKFNDKEIDVLLGISLKDEATENFFEFSNGYSSADIGVVMQKKHKKDADEKLSFIGKKIGVLENNYLEKYIRLANIQNAKIVTFESTAAMLEALLSGQQKPSNPSPKQEKDEPLDLVLIDKNTAQHWIAKNPELQYTSLNMTREYAFRVTKGSPLLKTINGGMGKVLGTQKFIDLKRRWSIDES
jgi:ABC-type amino acid transport substrate-binding protein